MKCILLKLNRGPVALALLLACSPALAGGQTYQWVDQSGNVVYGDSPPQANTRQVGSPDSSAVLRAAASQAAVATDGTPSESGGDDETALAEALAKLNSVMGEVQALNKQVGALEKERAQSLVDTTANAAPKQVETVAVAQPQMLIEAPTIMEIAVVNPQPIESRMSEKDRVRSRWESENAGQKRFLERLSKMGDSKRQ
jgi:hypothetical protein